MRLFLLLLLIAFPASGCRKHVVIKPAPAPENTLVDGTFITSAGSWFCSDRNTTATLRVDVSTDKIEWHYDYAKRNRSGSSGSSGSSGTGSQMSLGGPAAPWFIYVETPDSLWFSDGVNNLTHAISTHGVLKWNQVISIGQLEPDRERIPAEIIPRLSAELQKLLPPGEDTHERPSI